MIQDNAFVVAELKIAINLVRNPLTEMNNKSEVEAAIWNAIAVAAENDSKLIDRNGYEKRYNYHFSGNTEMKKIMQEARARKQAIITLHAKKLTTKQIAKEMGCTVHTVRRYLSKNGLASNDTRGGWRGGRKVGT